MERIFELDLVRGVAILIMIALDAPPQTTYAILHHAPWEGLTIADLAFPLFVFSMGMSAAVSSSRKIITWQKIFRRTVLMFAVGLILNTMMMFSFGGDFEHFRFFGIIQRLALTYALGMTIVKSFSDDKKILIASIILLIASSLGFHIYTENSFAEEHNISGAVDLIFPGVNHMLTPTHDPEGLYGTIASTSSMLFGFLAGRWRDKISRLIIFGAALLILGGLWSQFDIIAKKIWTPPFALLTSGGYVILTAIFLRLFELKPDLKKFFQPIATMGKNPLFFFVALNIALIFLISIGAWSKMFELMRIEIFSVEFNVAIFCWLWTVLWIMAAKLLDKLGLVIKI